jgi:AsmA protein
MRPSRVLLIAAACAFGLLLIAVAVFAFLFDANDYRDELARLVESRTGRKLVIDGDLELAFIPWLSVAVGHTTLGDAPGFGPEPFMSVDAARLEVRLLPLIFGRVQVGDIVLEAPQVRLVTDASGHSNWSDLIAPAAAPTHDVAAPATRPSVAGLTVHDGRIDVLDRVAGSQLAITALELETGSMTVDRPFALELAFDLHGGDLPDVSLSLVTRATVARDGGAIELAAPVIEASLPGPTTDRPPTPMTVKAERVDVDFAQQRYSAMRPRVTVTLHRPPAPAAGMALELEATQLVADLASGRAQLQDFALDAAGARLTGNLAASELLTAPMVTGSIALADVSPRNVLERLGFDAPPTADPDAFAALGLRGQVEATSDRIALNDLEARFDDSRVTGRVAVTDLGQPAIEFDLDVDRIDLDRYLPPEANVEQPPPREIPVDLIRGQRTRGQLRIGEAMLAGTRLQGVRIGVDADEPRPHVDSSLTTGRANAVQLSGDSRVEMPWLSDMSPPRSGLRAHPRPGSPWSRSGDTP